MPLVVISAIAVVLYVTSSLLFGWRLFSLKANQSGSLLASKNVLIALGLLAVVFHSIALYQNLFTPVGLNIGVFNAISLISWFIALMVLLAALSNPVENLTILLLPIAAVAVILELAFPVEHTLLKAQAMELKIHIFISIMAYSLITIAAVQAIVLSIQDSHLRNRRPGGFIRALPPLETMETLLFQMIGVGFFLHSLSLITGIIYIEDIFAQHVAHKTILSICAWFVFATLLWGRWRFGWRGNTAIRWTLSGFFVLLLAYVGSKWVLEIVLSRG